MTAKSSRRILQTNYSKSITRYTGPSMQRRCPAQDNLPGTGDNPDEKSAPGSFTKTYLYEDLDYVKPQGLEKSSMQTQETKKPALRARHTETHAER